MINVSASELTHLKSSVARTEADLRALDQLINQTKGRLQQVGNHSLL